MGWGSGGFGMGAQCLCIKKSRFHIGSHLLDVWRQYLSSVFDLDWKSFIWSLPTQ